MEPEQGVDSELETVSAEAAPEQDIESENGDDEPVVQSEFNIPSYLRGQHFDPGE